MTIKSLTAPQVVKEDGVPLGLVFQNNLDGSYLATDMDKEPLLETEFYGDAVQYLLSIPNEEGDTGNIVIE